MIKITSALIAIALVLMSCGDYPKKSNGHPSPDSPDEQKKDDNPTDGTTIEPKQAPDSQPIPIPNPTPTPTPKPDPKPLPIPQDPGFNIVIEATLESIQKDLVNRFCLGCHQGPNASAQLDLSDLSQYVKGQRGIGGYRGQLINPGKSGTSILALIIATENQNQKMPPPTSNIPSVNDQQLNALKTWIDSLPPIPGGTDEPDGGDDWDR